MRSPKDSNYPKYSRLQSNLAEQHWNKQKMLMLIWSETVIEISRIFFRIERGLSNDNLEYRRIVI